MILELSEYELGTIIRSVAFFEGNHYPKFRQFHRGHPKLENKASRRMQLAQAHVTVSGLLFLS